MLIPAISKNIKNLNYSVIREMSGRARNLEGVINLGIGEPDFDTPPPIIDKAFEDARKGHTHYTHSQGDPELLEKLSGHILSEMGVHVPAAAILVTHGGMGSLTAAFRTLLEQKDEAILIEPHFPDYIAHITLAGGVIKKVPSFFEDKFIPRPELIEQAITNKTRILVLNYPNNPTGAVIPGDVLDRIAEIATRYNLIVLSDEVYDSFSFERPHESIYTRNSMDDRTLVIKSFSKTYAMTGWRIGYSFGPENIISQMIKVVNYSTSCASSIGQRAAIAAIDFGSPFIEKMKGRFKARIDLVCGRLEKMDNIKVIRPRGSFYVFVDISRFSYTSREFAIDLLKQQKVVVIPGYAFGGSCDGCIRIACTVSKVRLEEAMDRVETYISNLQEG